MACEHVWTIVNTYDSIYLMDVGISGLPRTQEKREEAGPVNEIEGEWLTTQEAMAVLQVGRTRLWRLVREGGLTAYQRGPDRRARYYKRAEVQRLARKYRPATQGGHGEHERA